MEKKQCTNDICLCVSDDERNECGYFNEVEPSTSLPSEHITLNDAKNQIAKKYGHESWRDWSLSCNEPQGKDVPQEFQSEAAELYADLQKKQLTERVKELEEQLSVMPTRKHQIVSEVVELREQVKQARNEAIQECIDIVEEIYKPLLIQNISLSEAIKELENLKSKQ